MLKLHMEEDENMRKRIWGIGLLIMAAFGFMLGGVAAYRGAPGPASGTVAAPATLNKQRADAHGCRVEPHREVQPDRPS